MPGNLGGALQRLRNPDRKADLQQMKR